MCWMKTPSLPPAVPMQVPSSDAAQRQGEVEQALRRRRAGIKNDVVTTPIGLPVGKAA